MAEERKVEVEGANAHGAAPWQAGSEESKADAALKAKEEQHIRDTVKPQTEVEKQVAAKQAEQAQHQKDEAEADANRQREANEKIVTGEESNGISHMDLLRASFHIDGHIDLEGEAREQGELLADRPNAHQPKPENFEQAPPKPKWEPGK